MTTYYVGPGGNNSNAGTSWALRKLTLNGAEDIPVQAGDTVYVGPGTYRELLTVDVSGSSGSVITYIGDYTGANTDGVGGVVRITGSDNDQTATRSYCISASSKNYRVFAGLAFDTTQNALVLLSGCQQVTLRECHFADGRMTKIDSTGAGQAGLLVDGCYFGAGEASSGGISVYLQHSTQVNDAGHVIQNSLFVASYIGVYASRVGGVTVKNSVLLGASLDAVLANDLTTGQTVTLNNNVFVGAVVRAITAGQLVEDYNAFWGVATPRTNVSTGANSLSRPPLFDLRWFFEACNGGTLVTPFDLASYSTLLNVAGTSPTTADLRGTTVQGAEREWGALEYDSTLDIAAGGGTEAHLDSEVLDTATTPGTYHAPAASEVIDTAVFGVSSGTSGTVHLPDAAEVLDTAVFGAASAVSGTYHAPDAAEVIDSAVFGPASGTAGTYDTTGDAPSAAEIADAVWNELRSGHVAAGSFGAVSEWASTGGLDAAGVRTAVGLASANLDTQLGAIPTLAEVQAEFAALADDTTIAAAVRTELATELGHLDADVSSVTASVDEAAIATAAAAAILADPANKLDTDASGYVKISSTAAMNTLDSLLAALGGGAGAITWVYTLTSSVSGAPIPDAEIWVTARGDTTVVASGWTDVSGQVTFHLDAGEIDVYRRKSGWNFTNPDPETVS